MKSEDPANDEIPRDGQPRLHSLRDLGVPAMCLSAQDAALFLGLPVNAARRVQRLGARGELPRVRVGRAFVFPLNGLAKFVLEADQADIGHKAY
jgi:hypothetical protein